MQARVPLIEELISPARPTAVKRDSYHVFFEVTRSICPACRRPIDAEILLRDGKVYMRKRCPEHGPFEALVYSDAEDYVTTEGLG